jgi:hypothetical protein
MNTQQKIIQSDALPPNTIKPLEPGATSIFDSAIIKQNNQNNLQNKLGGRKQFKGGNPPVIQVSPSPSYALNKSETNAINAQITGLAVNNQNQMAYDKLANNGNASDTAKIASQQQLIYNGKGGFKRGGSWPNWGCLSGGKKSRKNCKKRKRRKRRSRKYRK